MPSWRESINTFGSYWPKKIRCKVVQITTLMRMILTNYILNSDVRRKQEIMLTLFLNKNLFSWFIFFVALFYFVWKVFTSINKVLLNLSISHSQWQTDRHWHIDWFQTTITQSIKCSFPQWLCKALSVWRDVMFYVHQIVK